MLKDIKHYSHDLYVPFHNRCLNDHGNHTHDHAGYNHVHDLWHSETYVYLLMMLSFPWYNSSYQFKDACKLRTVNSSYE